MIAIHQAKVISVQKSFEKDIKRHYTNALKNLNKLKDNLTNQQEVDYLDKVIELFETEPDILVKDAGKLETIKNKFRKIPILSKKTSSVLNKKVKSTIGKQIIKKLGYASKRKTFYPKYFNKIGIKVCVYCNSQLAISALKPSRGYSSKFDVDHYHSKDDYPFLSICLFNLYPACASCNRAKGVKKIEFELYTSDLTKTIKSDYRFKICPYSKAKYLTMKSSEVIEFTFEEPSYSNSDIETFNEVFHIAGVYNTQKDLIEELIIKNQIYNKAYLKTLKHSFDKLSIQPELFKRTLVSNYTEDKDLHKRPMSKLVMDIAKELGLI